MRSGWEPCLACLVWKEKVEKLVDRRMLLLALLRVTVGIASCLVVLGTWYFRKMNSSSWVVLVDMVRKKEFAAVWFDRQADCSQAVAWHNIAVVDEATFFVIGNLNMSKLNSEKCCHMNTNKSTNRMSTL